MLSYSMHNAEWLFGLGKTINYKMWQRMLKYAVSSSSDCVNISTVTEELLS